MSYGLAQTLIRLLPGTSIIQRKAVLCNSPSSSDLPGLGASLMIYLCGMKLSPGSMSLENTALLALPGSSSFSAAAYYK